MTDLEQMRSACVAAAATAEKALERLQRAEAIIARLRFTRYAQSDYQRDMYMADVCALLDEYDASRPS